MQLFEALGLPSPRECPGMAGLLLGIIGGLGGVVWLWAFQGAIPAFVLIAASVVVGIFSFMYCVVWEQSIPGLQ